MKFSLFQGGYQQSEPTATLFVGNLPPSIGHFDQIKEYFPGCIGGKLPNDRDGVILATISLHTNLCHVE